MNKELVLAVFKEPLNWLDGYKGEATIYCKGSNQYIPLPNVGREANTYLHHIVSNYNKLADYTIFAQGNPFDHSSNFLDVVNKNSVEDMWRENIKKYPASLMRRHKLLGLGEHKMFKLGYNINDHYRNLINSNVSAIRKTMQVEYTGVLHKVWGAMWVVPKYNILSKPLQIYQDLLLTSKYEDFGICMEWLWFELFDKGIKYL